MNYEKKYLKYKNKYLKLLSKYQTGGTKQVHATGNSSFRLESEKISASVSKYTLNYNDNQVSFLEMISLLKSGNISVIDLIKKSIVEFPNNEVFFECPPTTYNIAASTPFEYVLIKAPDLRNKEPDSASFQSYFKSKVGSDVIYFPNLSKDAILVVPLPDNSLDYSKYTHLSAFIRLGKSKQVNAVLKELGMAFEKTLKKDPTKKFWLSTSGLGVYWLHFRIDSNPKYYKYDFYKN